MAPSQSKTVPPAANQGPKQASAQETITPWATVRRIAAEAAFVGVSPAIPFTSLHGKQGEGYEFAQKRHGKPFSDLDREDRQSLLREPSDEREETTPEIAEGGRFFDLVERLTIYGYNKSEAGLIEELHCQGGGFLSEYPAACKHEEH